MLYSKLASKGRVDQSARGPVEFRDFCQADEYVSRAPLLPAARESAEPHLRDRELERLTMKFREVQSHISTLSQCCLNYSKGVHAFVKHCVKINRQFEILLNSAQSWTTLCSTTSASKRGDYPTTSPLEPFLEKANDSDGLTFAFSEMNQSIRDPSRHQRRQKVALRLIEADLRIVKQCLVEPLLSIAEICKRVGRTLQRREVLAVAVKERMERLAWLENRTRGASSLDRRQQRKKARVARDLELEKLKLESLSTTIKVELKVLFKLFDAFVTTWAPNFFLTIFSIAYTMHRYLGRAGVDESITHQQALALFSLSEPGQFKQHSLKKRVAQTPSDISCGLPSIADIVASFHLDFDSVVSLLGNFRVTSFESLYQLTLSSATESAKSYFQDNAVRGTVPTLYATAIFGFSSTEPTHSDDLSFCRNDIIKVIKRNENGWWYGEAIRTKQRGYFPASCVQLEKLL